MLVLTRVAARISSLIVGTSLAWITTGCSRTDDPKSDSDSPGVSGSSVIAPAVRDRLRASVEALASAKKEVEAQLESLEQSAKKEKAALVRAGVHDLKQNQDLVHLVHRISNRKVALSTIEKRWSEASSQLKQLDLAADDQSVETLLAQLPNGADDGAVRALAAHDLKSENKLTTADSIALTAEEQSWLHTLSEPTRPGVLEIRLVEATGSAAAHANVVNQTLAAAASAHSKGELSDALRLYQDAAAAMKSLSNHTEASTARELTLNCIADLGEEIARRKRAEVAKRLEDEANAIAALWATPEASRDLSEIVKRCDTIIVEINPDDAFARSMLEQLIAMPTADPAIKSLAREALIWWGQAPGRAREFRDSVRALTAHLSDGDIASAESNLASARKSAPTPLAVESLERDIASAREREIECRDCANRLNRSSEFRETAQVIDQARALEARAPALARRTGLSDALHSAESRQARDRTAGAKELSALASSIDQMKSIEDVEQGRKKALALRDLVEESEISTINASLAAKEIELRAQSSQSEERADVAKAEATDKARKQKIDLHDAEALRISGSLSKAMAAYEKYLANHPDSTERAQAHRGMGDCLVRLGDEALAKGSSSSGESYFQKAIAAYGDAAAAAHDCRDASNVSVKAHCVFRSLILNLRLETAYKKLQRKSSSYRATYLKYFNAVNNDMKLLRSAFALEEDETGETFVTKAEEQVRSSRD